INPLLKGDEINHILSDSGAESVIVHQTLASQLCACLSECKPGMKIFQIQYEDTEQPVVSSGLKKIEVDSTSLSRGSAAELRTKKPGPADLAVLVYTSGTTGLPKGAMLTHANLLAAITMKSSRMSVYPEDCLLVVLPLCHIYGMVVVMLGTLIEGGSLAIMESFDSLKALACIEENKVTILPAVPAMYQFMAMELGQNRFDLSSLKFGVVGGASIACELIESVEKAFGCPIREGYAMTESACVATLTPLNEGKARSGSVGPAIDGVEIAILGEDLEPIGCGREKIGQVAVAGANVMKGYYNQPETSKEAFHGRFFLTGDLGWLDQDGYLYIVGRTKELIIRGGQNIYPRELELAILKMPGVADVAVVGVPDKFMGERVKAVIVKSADEPKNEITEDAVKSYCSKHLAQYKVPRLVEFRDSLPRNSTGKVLKRLLVEGKL
ncbi:MAG: AMP-binding protein, partial [Candidatus Obscuribacterales bacterium]|nr:AMP-binding protein [Candidatus Obscuribacterales bacterium]